jgi:molybdenum cofactor cytidylyltransferase
MNLSEALRLSNNSRLALVGAGGKTTALFQIARQLAPQAIVTTTTHLATHQSHLSDHHYVIEGDIDIDSLRANLCEGVNLFTGPKGDRDRLAGVSGDNLNRLLALADEVECPLLIESDGAKLRPVKAPGEHEPPIPDFVDTVVVVIGLSALGEPITSKWVHRPELFATLSQCEIGVKITGDILERVLTHPNGGLKNIPRKARRVLLLNQADTPELQSKARGLVDKLLNNFHSVIIGALKNKEVYAAYEPVAGVILAAGGSKRLGQPKQLLTWKNKSFINHVVDSARNAGLHQIIVVTGAYSDKVKSALKGISSVFLTHNPDWTFGQSTSIKKGLESISSESGAALFLLTDQPWVSSSLIRTLIEKHAQTLGPVVAPIIDGRRGNPILFDRIAFSDFEDITGDVGGRALFSRYNIVWVPWHDPRALMDIDTVDDYEKFLQGA